MVMFYCDSTDFIVEDLLHPPLHPTPPPLTHTHTHTHTHPYLSLCSVSLRTREMYFTSLLFRHLIIPEELTTSARCAKSIKPVALAFSLCFTELLPAHSSVDLAFTFSLPLLLLPG